MKYNRNALFSEYSALCTLLMQYKRRYSKNIDKSESPDFIDIDKNIGIEITRSFYEGQGELNGCHNKLKNSTNPKLDILEEKIFRKYNAKVFLYNRQYGGYTRFFWASTNHIKESFIRKIASINKDTYKICTKYDLYICTQNLHDIDQEEINILLKNLIKIQKPYERKFRYVYIDDSPNFYELNLVKNNSFKFILDENIISNIQLKVKNLINNSI